jgi:predicted ester cyclase
VIIDRQIAEGDTVVNILTLQGTHSGAPYVDIEPTGQMVGQMRIAVQRFNDEGKIVEVLSFHSPLMSEGAIYE